MALVIAALSATVALLFYRLMRRLVRVRETAAHSDRLQAMGVNSTLFVPCFSRPEQGDFLSVMRQNVKNMEKIFE